MDLPRREQVRQELADMGSTYLVVLVALLVGFALLVLASAPDDIQVWYAPMPVGDTL